MSSHQGRMSSHQGSRYRVIHCEGALAELDRLLVNETPNKQKSLKNHLMLQIKRLANGVSMTKEHFKQQGALPAIGGIQNGHFYCLKRQPIRGYCWESKRYPNTWYISHYIVKRVDKLKPTDTRRVGLNWNRIEELGYEF